MIDAPEKSKNISPESFQAGISYLCRLFSENQGNPTEEAKIQQNIQNLIAVAYAENKDNWQNYEQTIVRMLPGWPQPNVAKSAYPDNIPRQNDTYDTHQQVSFILYEANKTSLRPKIEAVMAKYAETGMKRGQSGRTEVFKGLDENQETLWGIIEIVREHIANRDYPPTKLARDFYFLTHYTKDSVGLGGTKTNIPDINPFAGVMGLRLNHPFARAIKREVIERLSDEPPDSTTYDSYMEITGYMNDYGRVTSQVNRLHAEKKFKAAQSVLCMAGAETALTDAKEFNEQSNIEKAIKYAAIAIGHYPELEKLKELLDSLRKAGNSDTNPLKDKHTLEGIKDHHVAQLRKNLLVRLNSIGKITREELSYFMEILELLISDGEWGFINNEEDINNKSTKVKSLLELKKATDIIEHHYAYGDISHKEKIDQAIAGLVNSIEIIPEESLHEWQNTFAKIAGTGNEHLNPLRAANALRDSSTNPIPTLRLNLAKKVNTLPKIPDDFIVFFIAQLGSEQERIEATAERKITRKSHIAKKIGKRILES